MGRTIASITQTWQQEEAALKRFKRALRKDDQVLLDELLVLSRLHLAEASYASNLYPLDMYLIAILLEVYKQLKAMQRVLNGGIDPKEELDASKEERFIALLDATFSAVQTSTQSLENLDPDSNLTHISIANTVDDEEKEDDDGKLTYAELTPKQDMRAIKHYHIAELSHQPTVSYDDFEEAP